MDDTTDLQLIDELTKRSPESFERFLDLYGGRLYGFAFRMCRNPEDAQDIFQDTLIGVMRSLKDFRGDSSFKTWLFRIATNACGKMHRKGKFEPERELALDDYMPRSGDAIPLQIPSNSEDQEQRLLRREVQRVMDDAIAELPRHYRVVFILRDVEELSTEETGSILGLSEEAVKSRLHRARLHVRNRLGEYFNSR